MVLTSGQIAVLFFFAWIFIIFAIGWWLDANDNDDEDE